MEQETSLNVSSALTAAAQGFEEILENPAGLRENGAVIAGHDWVDGRQAARFQGL